MNSNSLIRIQDDWQEFVRRFVDSLSYGKVEIVVHDSQIVEIDTTERMRFAQGGLPLSTKRPNSDSTESKSVRSITSVR